MYFEQNDGGLLRAYGKMEGLLPGLYRMTINEYGDLSNGCDSTGKKLLHLVMWFKKKFEIH